MLIKDLEISKELNAVELSAVRGGSVNQGNYGYQGGSGQYVGGGVLIASPVIQQNGQYMSQGNYNFEQKYTSYDYTYTPTAIAAGILNTAFAV